MTELQNQRKTINYLTKEDCMYNFLTNVIIETTHIYALAITFLFIRSIWQFPSLNLIHKIMWE